MTHKTTGGAAFPIPKILAKDWCGMTLRDYFMAHAPAEPQPWFVPVMPECPAPIYQGEVSMFIYTSWMDAIRAEGEEGFFTKNGDEIDSYAAEKRKQRFVQWPAAWADEMLKEREK